MKRYILLLLLTAMNIMFSQPFVEISSGLPAVDSSSIAWGDYDNDGDLDIIISGYGKNGRITKIFRNDGNNVFTDIEAEIQALNNCSVKWTDLNNDSYLDIIITGYYYNNGNCWFTEIYMNSGSGIFDKQNAGLTGLAFSSVDCGDYDNDGDNDILLTGFYNDGSYHYVSKIYRNDSLVYTDINAGLTGLAYGSSSWCDYDNDADLDILLTGYSASSNPVSVSKIYRNDGNNIFININAGLTGIWNSSAAWGDYDNDGDPDILLAGDSVTVKTSKIYRNNGGTFTCVSDALASVDYSSVAWGDCDNDGDLDILLTGLNAGNQRISSVYRNDGGIFTDISAGLTGVNSGSSAWCDYDNDGDLDILLTGWTGTEKITKLYRNNCFTVNTEPGAPDSLSVLIAGNDVSFSWSRSTDGQTPQNGLSYNFYLGKRPGKANISPPMSDISTGYRKIVHMGNICQNRSWEIKNLPDGTYYWSVQAVDNAFAGSEFAPEKKFYKGSMYPPGSVEIINDGHSVEISWTEVNGASSYRIYACDTPYGTYNDISLQGTFGGTSWIQTAAPSEKKFYFVIAVTE